MLETLSKSQLRKFGFTLAIVFVGLFGCILPALGHKAFPQWPFILGGVLSACALIIPTRLKYIYVPWMKVGHVLGWINTRIILSIIYFVLITPLGFVMRLCGYNPMARQYDLSLKSYRTPSLQKPASHMEKPFS